MEKKIIDGSKIMVMTGEKPNKPVIDKLSGKKLDRLNAMRIALTYLEAQPYLNLSSKQLIKLAEEFYQWTTQDEE